MKHSLSETGPRPTEEPTKTGTPHGGPVATTGSGSPAPAEPGKTPQPPVNFASSLGPQKATSFRIWVGVQVEALLDGYWNNRPSEPVKAEIVKTWIAGLQKFTAQEIRDACRSWPVEHPRTKPNVGDIVGLIRDAQYAKARMHPRPEPQEPLQRKKNRVSAKRASEIIKEVGLTLQNRGR